MILCTFWRKIENLEYETQEDLIFSFFLRVVSARKKYVSSHSSLYLLRYLQALTTRRNFHLTMYAFCNVSNYKLCDSFELCYSCTSQNSVNVALRCGPRSLKKEPSLIFDTTCRNFFDAISSKKANPAKMFQSLWEPNYLFHPHLRGPTFRKFWYT